MRAKDKQGSISSTFYIRLFSVQIPKVVNLFYAFGIYEHKSCTQNVDEIDTRRTLDINCFELLMKYLLFLLLLMMMLLLLPSRYFCCFHLSLAHLTSPLVQGTFRWKRITRKAKLQILINPILGSTLIRKYYSSKLSVCFF